MKPYANLLFNINDDDSDYVKIIKNEANFYIEENKGLNKSEDIRLSADIMIELSKHHTNYDAIRRVLYLTSTFSRTGLFSPLTLTEGEFVFTRYGLSTNRRFPYILKDVVGIYNSIAYKICQVEYYYIEDNISSLNLINDNDIEELSYDQDRIYLSTGGVLTNYYFNKCYILDKYINSKKYFPISTIAMNVCCCIIDNKYINVIQANIRAFKELSLQYKLNICQDESKEIEKFGVNKNINIYELISKRSTI